MFAPSIAANMPVRRINRMSQRTWFITGSFGRHMSEQLLERGDLVAGTAQGFSPWVTQPRETSPERAADKWFRISFGTQRITLYSTAPSGRTVFWCRYLG